MTNPVGFARNNEAKYRHEGRSRGGEGGGGGKEAREREVEEVLQMK